MAGYGYTRVSTRDQNEARQLDALSASGITSVFVDKASGKDFDRPEYKRMVRVAFALDVPDGRHQRGGRPRGTLICGGRLPPERRPPIWA